jgi:hypothetical protein
VKEFSKHVETLSKIWSPQTESNRPFDKDELKQKAKEAAKSWKEVQQALFTPRTTERDYEKEEWLKKKRTGSMAFSKIPDVNIDSCGVFKYILIEVFFFFLRLFFLRTSSSFFFRVAVQITRSLLLQFFEMSRADG